MTDRVSDPGYGPVEVIHDGYPQRIRIRYDYQAKNAVGQINAVPIVTRATSYMVLIALIEQFDLNLNQQNLLTEDFLSNDSGEPS